MRHKLIFVILFCVGLFIEILAFYISQADNIPIILKFISPKYVQANKTYEKLEKTKNITIEEKGEGFSIIETIILDELKILNPDKDLTFINVTSIDWRSTAINTTKGFQRTIEAKLSNGQIYKSDLETLKSKINELKTNNIYHFATFVFILGVIIQIVGFIIQLFEQIRANRGRLPIF